MAFSILVLSLLATAWASSQPVETLANTHAVDQELDVVDKIDATAIPLELDESVVSYKFDPVFGNTSDTGYTLPHARGLYSGKYMAAAAKVELDALR